MSASSHDNALIAKIARLPVPSYANSAATRRAIKAIQNAGLNIGSVKLHPSGEIEFITGVSLVARPAANDYDRLDAAGLL